MSDLGVLVLSCDRYSSLWDLFFARWERFWPDCPYPVYLLSNRIKYESSGIITVNTGEDRDWSSNLLTVLDQIPHENLLLMIEDAPLNAIVDGVRFERLYTRFRDEHLNYLNLKASPEPNGVEDAEMGELLPGSLYRTSLVPCLWRKEILKSLIIHGETAWQFEIIGAERSDRFNNFRSMRRPFFGLIHCVIRGKIDRRSAKVLRLSGELKGIQFPVMTIHEQARLFFLELRSAVLNTIVPWSLRRRLRAIIYKNFSGKDRVI